MIRDKESCWRYLEILRSDLAVERMSNLPKNLGERAWNVWLTARSHLLLPYQPPPIENRWEACEALEDCARRAKEVQASTIEDWNAEWALMEETWKLCETLRRVIIAFLVQ